jgi:hypothetical protein
MKDVCVVRCERQSSCSNPPLYVQVLDRSTATVLSNQVVGEERYH